MYTSRSAAPSDEWPSPTQIMILKLSLALIFAATLSCHAVVAAAEPTVDTVAVTVVTAAGKLPPPVAKRMEQSVAVVAEQILLGNLTAQVALQKTQKEQIIREVFDKILTGYSVQSVTIYPGSNTAVIVRLIPWSVTIKSVTVNISVEGVTPETEKIVRRDLAGAEKLFADIYIGMPLLATDWTHGILKRELGKFMAEHLPEFRADFDLTPTHEAIVNMTVYPKMPVVRNVNLFMRSDTVPTFALLGYRSILERKTNTLVGVPVAFVKRHRQELSDDIASFLDGQADFRRLGMKTALTMDVGEELSVTCRSDSERFRLRLEGWLDVGKSDDENALKFRLHAGTKVSPTDEFFILADFAPEDVKFSWNVGYGRDLSSKTNVAFRYDPRAHQPIFDVTQYVLPKLRLRYERNRVTRLDEWGVRYGLHDFMSLEYVRNREEGWLRLIGNF